MEQKKEKKAPLVMKAFTRVQGSGLRYMFEKEPRPPNVQTAQIINVTRGHTSKESTDGFQLAIATQQKANGIQSYCITIGGVGLKCDGRSSCYDMYYFPHSQNMYAIDSEDYSFIYQATTMLN